MKRNIAMLIALLLLVTAIPFEAFAARKTGQAGQEQNPGTISATYINPLYADEMTEDDLQKGELSVYSSVSRASLYADVIYHDEEASAADEIRESIVNRETEVSFGYQIPAELYTNEGLSGIGQDIFAQVCRHTGNPSEGDYILWHYGGYFISASYQGTSEDGTCYNSIITYTMTYYATKEQEDQVTEAVDALLAQLKPEGTDYKKIKTVYDWICANITYDYENLDNTSYTLKHSAYAAIIDRTAVCQGYALLFYRLALEMDIDCRIIVGIGNGGDHAWNIVQLDGLYYNLDSTWDAGMGEYYNFLLNDEEFLDHARDSEYAAEEFYAEYPMSEVSYSEDGLIAFGNCGTGVTWSLNRTGTFTVSGQGAMTEYVFEDNLIETPWEKWKDSIETIVLEEGVTTVGGGTFQSCENLTAVILPESVTAIGDYAFNCCLNLTDIEFTDNLQSIGKWAFRSCSITRVQIPFSVNHIGDLAFSGIETLEAFEVAEDNPYYCSVEGALLSKDLSLFYQCPAKKDGTYKIPAGVNKIEMCAFMCCRILDEVVIPDTVTWIGQESFVMCEELSELNIPYSVEQIDIPFMRACSQVSYIFVDENNACYADQDGVLFSKDMSSILYYPDGKTEESYKVPEGVTYIGQVVFEYAKVKKLYLPKSLTAHEELSFRVWYVEEFIVDEDNSVYCSSAGILYNKDMTSLLSYPEQKKGEFYRIPDSVTYIGPVGISSQYLKQLIVPASVKRCGEGALSSPSLEEVFFLGSAMTVEKNAWVFNDITKPVVYYPADDTSWTTDVMAQYGNQVTWKPACEQHREETIEGRESTCMTHGLTDGIRCSVCNMIIVEQSLLELGEHQYDDMWIIQIATLEKDGEIGGSCEICQEVMTEAVARVTDFSLSKYNYNYGDTMHLPEVTVTDAEGKILMENVDYSVTYPTEVKTAGTYPVTVSGEGKYSFSKRLTFAIKPLYLEEAYLQKTDYTYTGRECTPFVIVKDKDGRVLVQDKDYTVAYPMGRTNVGIYPIRIKGIGNYRGSAILTFRILPKAVSAIKAECVGYNGVRLNWTKAAGATGYRIYYRRPGSSAFTLLADTRNTHYTKTNLTKGMTYYFKVVPYYSQAGSSTKYYSTATGKVISVRR